MKKTINFQAEIFDLSRINPLVSRYKLFIAYADEPANDYIFSEDVLNNLAITIKGCPVVAGFMNNIDGSVLGGHEDDLALDENNKVKRTPTPIPVGFAAYDVDPWWEEYKNRKYLTTFIYIWDGRFPELDNLSERSIFQSLEVAVENDKQGKYKIVTEAYALGLCLLENVSPAFEFSHIEKFSKENIQSQIDLLKKEFKIFSSKYDDLDFTIPDEVKEITKLGLDLYKKHNKGGTSVSLANARFIQNNDIVTPEKIKNINKYCIRMSKKDFNKDDESDSNWIAYCLWGGNAGRTWSSKLVEAMNKRDEEKMSYFAVNDGINTNFSNSEVVDDIKTNEEGEKVIKDAVEKFSLNSDQIREILRNALTEFKYTNNDYEYNKYYVDCYDAEYVYVWDNEDDKTYRMEYTIAENIATINVESKNQVIRGSFILVGQEQEKLSDENTEEMANEENKEDMSSNDYVDNTAMQAMNENSAENNEQLSSEMLSDENKDDKDVMLANMKEEMSSMQEKMSKLEADIVNYTDENTKLKEFKASIEKTNKEFAVETTLKEVIDVLPKEELEACRLSSENFSLENIDVWKNEVKAKAFNFSKGLADKKSYIQVGFPVSDKPKNGTGLWD